MTEQLSDETTQIKLWEEYFEQNIVPLVEADNKIKDKYRSRFWCYLWTIMFLMSSNALIVLYNVIMHDKPISYQQLAIVNLVAFSLLILPIYSYYRQPRVDIFAEFIKFFGNWKLAHNSEVKLVHSPIIPKHDYVSSSHNVDGEIADVKLQLRDTFYEKKHILGSKNWRYTVSDGVILYIEFPQKFKDKILIFDRSGFYRKGRFPDLENQNGNIEIPAANYFNIFSNAQKYTESFISPTFLERLLDMSDDFEAKHTYVEINENYMRIYFEGSSLYFENYKFWSNKIDKNKFLQLHNRFESVMTFVYTVKDLTRRTQDD